MEIKIITIVPRRGSLSRLLLTVVGKIAPKTRTAKLHRFVSVSYPFLGVPFNAKQISRYTQPRFFVFFFSPRRPVQSALHLLHLSDPVLCVFFGRFYCNPFCSLHHARLYAREGPGENDRCFTERHQLVLLIIVSLIIKFRTFSPFAHVALASPVCFIRFYRHSRETNKCGTRSSINHSHGEGKFLPFRLGFSSASAAKSKPKIASAR